MKNFAAIAPAEPTQADRPVLPTNGTPNFYFVHFPNNWECVETENGPEWLPQLKCLYEKPGVNGVNGRGALPDSGQSRTAIADQGGTVIERSFLPAEVRALDAHDNMPSGTYVVRYKARQGYVHRARWDVPVVRGGQMFFKTNHPQAWAFRRALVAHGKVERPDPEILEMIMERKRNRVNRNLKQAHIPDRKRAAEDAMADLEQMQRAANANDYAETLTIASTKAQIVERLSALGVDFKPTASKAELLQLLPGAAQ